MPYTLCRSALPARGEKNRHAGFRAHIGTHAVEAGRAPPSDTMTLSGAIAIFALLKLYRRDKMNSYKGSGFADRLSMAAKARKAQLDRFRAQPRADDPAVADRNAARMAAGIARGARVAERKAAKQAEAAAVQTALEVERAAGAARDAEAAAKQATRAAALKAEQKVARDARYAARKARVKK